MDVDRAASPRRSEYESASERDHDADHDEAAARQLKEGDVPTTIESMREKIFGADRPEVVEVVQGWLGTLVKEVVAKVRRERARAGLGEATTGLSQGMMEA